MTALAERRGGSEPPRVPVVMLGFSTACLLALALFPWFPAGARLQQGSEAPWTLIAPRGVSYDSQALTEARRAEAAAAVQDVLVLDPSVRDREIAELDRQLALIQQLREETSISASARESGIRIIPGPGQLSEPAVQAIIAATGEEWQAIATEARLALGRTLSGAIREAELDAARVRSAGFVSTGLGGARLTAARELIAPRVVPTLVIDSARTNALRDEARRAVPAVHVSRARGDVVVTQGQVLTASDVELLNEAGLWTDGVRREDVAGALIVAVLAGAAVGGYAHASQSRALLDGARQALLVALVVAPVALAKFTLPFVLPDVDGRFLAYALPLAAAAMIAAVLLDLGLALLVALVVAAVTAFVGSYLPLAQGEGAGSLETLALGLSALGSGVAGALLVARADRLHRYLIASAIAAAVTASTVGAVWLVEADNRVEELPWLIGASALSGVLTSVVVVLVVAVLRRPLKVLTRVELMELTQLSQPLLRRLQDEAPGTFQHSILVGNLAERAAERIGADALLVRLGAYYHDVGKLVAPPFFIENSGDTNPHASLDHLQSTRVIMGHVTAGMEIAREAGLPEQVRAFIPQHHGTRLVTFFYRLAAAEDAAVDPELFRYPGPKPQTREAALVMLADSAEASVRASSDHSPEHIRELVEGLIRERVEEGQFDECEISLKDLRIVADSYASMLNAVYHPRIEYPGPTARELEQRGRRVAQEEASSRWPFVRGRASNGSSVVRSFDEADEDPAG